MHVSTVTSKSTFSTRGRMFDPYRSSLSHKKMEAFICTQDWLKDTPLPSLLDYDFEELQCVDQAMLMFQICINITIKYVLSNDKFFFFISYRVGFSTRCWRINHNFSYIVRLLHGHNLISLRLRCYDSPMILNHKK